MSEIKILVTNNKDRGPGSFRQALLETQQTKGGKYEIIFAEKTRPGKSSKGVGLGYWTIELETPLPALTNDAEINVNVSNPKNILLIPSKSIKVPSKLEGKFSNNRKMLEILPANAGGTLPSMSVMTIGNPHLLDKLYYVFPEEGKVKIGSTRWNRIDPAIKGWPNITLNQVHFSNNTAMGGNGEFGSGGGLGAGGAISLIRGSLIITNSTFQNLAAIGGEGDDGNNKGGKVTDNFKGKKFLPQGKYSSQKGVDGGEGGMPGGPSYEIPWAGGIPADFVKFVQPIALGGEGATEKLHAFWGQDASIGAWGQGGGGGGGGGSAKLHHTFDLVYAGKAGHGGDGGFGGFGGGHGGGGGAGSAWGDPHMLYPNSWKQRNRIWGIYNTKRGGGGFYRQFAKRYNSMGEKGGDFNGISNTNSNIKGGKGGDGSSLGGAIAVLSNRALLDLRSVDFIENHSPTYNQNGFYADTIFSEGGMITALDSYIYNTHQKTKNNGMLIESFNQSNGKHPLFGKIKTKGNDLVFVADHLQKPFLERGPLFIGRSSVRNPGISNFRDPAPLIGTSGRADSFIVYTDLPGSNTVEVRSDFGNLQKTLEKTAKAIFPDAALTYQEAAQEQTARLALFPEAVNIEKKIFDLSSELGQDLKSAKSKQSMMKKGYYNAIRGFAANGALSAALVGAEVIMEMYEADAKANEERVIKEKEYETFTELFEADNSVAIGNIPIGKDRSVVEIKNFTLGEDAIKLQNFGKKGMEFINLASGEIDKGVNLIKVGLKRPGNLDNSTFATIEFSRKSSLELGNMRGGITDFLSSLITKFPEFTEFDKQYSSWLIGPTFNSPTIQKTSEFVLSTDIGRFIELKRQSGSLNSTWKTIAQNGDDTIKGSSGTEMIVAQAGRDNIAPSFGVDTVDGGTGIDTVSFIDTLTPSIVETNNKGEMHVYSKDGSYSQDTFLQNIEIISVFGDSAILAKNFKPAEANLSSSDLTIRTGSGSYIEGSNFNDEIIISYDAEENSNLLTNTYALTSTITGGNGTDSLTLYMKELEDLDRISFCKSGDITSIFIDNNKLASATGVEEFYAGATTDDKNSKYYFTGLLNRYTDTDKFKTAPTCSSVQECKEIEYTESVYTKTMNGSAGNDILDSEENSTQSEIIRGGNGNDELIARRGHDKVSGEEGNDTVRGGNGSDIVTGGLGSDEIYGGFGRNIFGCELDGSSDKIIFKSDQFAFNPVLDSSGNQDGQRIDIINAVDPIDSIVIQGVKTSELSLNREVDYFQKGHTYSGIGISAKGVLEAIYVGDNFTMSQLETMVSGQP